MTDSLKFDPSSVAGAPDPTTDSGRLPMFDQPYDWAAIDRTVRTVGGAILKGLLDQDTLTSLNDDIDGYLDSHRERGEAASGSEIYDVFLGHNTIRLHGLVDKIPATADIIGRSDLVDWATRLVGGVAHSVLLNAGELIQIQPGEPAQFPHRDSDSWPSVPIGDDPIIVNAIIALDDCTLDNGATYVAAGSWQWQHQREPTSEDWRRAVMTAGDAVLFRGDLVHGGGENNSRDRRRVLSISYCAGWLRPVENSFLNVPLQTAAGLSSSVQALLGYKAHDSTHEFGGLVGLYENGDPAAVLIATR